MTAALQVEDLERDGAPVNEFPPAARRAQARIDELTRCDSDVDENFERFHLEMFDADVTRQLFPNLQVDDGDHVRTIVTRCADVDVFGESGYPEPAPFGCDHDLAGCPAITADAHVEFRRPCTIATGGERCEFLFSRAGSAPDTELVDGVPVRWNDGLSR